MVIFHGYVKLPDGNSYLVGGFKHDFYFPFHIWDVILPIDELIFFKMVKTHQPDMMYDIYICMYDAIYIYMG